MVGKLMSYGLAASVLLASTSVSRASLVLDFRFADGSTTKVLKASDAGTDIVVNVYAQFTGDSSSAFKYGYFTARSAVLTSNIDADITGRSLQSAFAASGSSTGTLQDINADNVTDLGASSLTSPTGWVNPRAADYTVGSNILLGAFTVHINSVTLPAAGQTVNSLRFDVRTDYNKTIGQEWAISENGNPATVDGATKFQGSSVTFAVTGPTSIPVPAAAGLGLFGFGTLASTRILRRRR
jgi:hypothetical protein